MSDQFKLNSIGNQPPSRRKSQSRALRARLMEGVVIEGVEVTVGAPVFVPHSARGQLLNCRVTFLGSRPRFGLLYTRRGIWVGKYDVIRERERLAVLDHPAVEPLFSAHTEV